MFSASLMPGILVEEKEAVGCEGKGDACKPEETRDKARDEATRSVSPPWPGHAENGKLNWQSCTSDSGQWSCNNNMFLFSVLAPPLWCKIGFHWLDKINYKITPQLHSSRM